MLSTLLNRLQAECPSFAVVAEAPGGAAITSVDAAAASAALKTLLELAVSNVYPVEAPEGKKPTDAIYRLVSARPVDMGGARVMTAVTFMVTVRATSYELLIPALGSVEAQVSASAAAISITDAQLDHDPVKNHWLAYLELQFAVPAVSGGDDWPCLLVSVIDYVADPQGAERMPIRQQVARSYQLIIVSDSSNIAALHTEVQTALLGWQANVTDNPYHYVSGETLPVPGSLSAWADIYRDTTWIDQAT